MVACMSTGETAAARESEFNAKQSPQAAVLTRGHHFDRAQVIRPQTWPPATTNLTLVPRRVCAGRGLRSALPRGTAPRHSLVLPLATPPLAIVLLSSGASATLVSFVFGT